MENLTQISFPTFEKASVWLVGAGPGDVKLLTLYAWHALQHADVIVHDALVAPDILALAPNGTVLESMGKRGGKASPKQHEITQRLIELAEQGKRVLRLKGGDPFVFGRGAEEALPILQKNIPVRIVPGISAGIAGSAYAGIPVSDGQSNQVISFVTGHDTSGQVPAVNWKALADSSPVIVFYMPIKHINKIRRELLNAGRKSDELISIISNATTSAQKVLDTTLENCALDLENSNVRSPAIMVVGPTVGFRTQLMNCFNQVSANMESELLLMTMLQAGLAHCTVVVDDNGGLLVSLFMAGLVGSATHCVTMCAPFVLSQVTTRLEHIPLSQMSEFKRISGAALVPYHLGRMTTYIILGFFVGLLAQGAIQFSGMKWISAGLLTFAALFFLGYALKRLGVSFPDMPLFGTQNQRAQSPLSDKLGQILKPFFARPTGLNGYFLGIGLGFLPCGLLYGALAAAGATGDFIAGAFAMAAFALGTVPSLMAVGFAGHLAGQKWRKVVSDLAPMLLIINAGVLVYLAYTLVI